MGKVCGSLVRGLSERGGEGRGSRREGWVDRGRGGGMEVCMEVINEGR
jgi:hypothetical protein